MNLPKVGEVYVNKLTPSSEYTVIRIEENLVLLEVNDIEFLTDAWAIEHHLILKQQAQQTNTCSHPNVREDKFFSAMVYKTCKDCGQHLN